LSNSVSELKNSDREDTNKLEEATAQPNSSIWHIPTNISTFTSEAKNVILRPKDIDIKGIDLKKIISLKKPLIKSKSNFQGSINPSPNSSDYQINVSF
jgi:hypothetical protein